MRAPTFNPRLFAWGLLSSLLLGAPALAFDSTQTRRYAVEVAGIRVGTLTAARRVQSDGSLLYSLDSHVKVNLLVHQLQVRYRVRSLFRDGILRSSTVETHTNRGDFTSRTEWRGDHYAIEAHQHKHSRRATDPRPIAHTLTTLFFAEPHGHHRVYSEYFGDYYTLTQPDTGRYVARFSDREDDYFYENGQMVRLLRKNPVKNFVMRLIQ